MSKTSEPLRRERAPRKPRRPSLTARVRSESGEDPRAALGRTIHRERIRLGISQEELADRTELDRTYISGMERGLRNPTFLVLLRLAQVLQIDPAILLQPDS